MSKKKPSKYVIDGRDPDPGEACIYVLRDPVTGEARYVGSTRTALNIRLGNHWKGKVSAGLADWMHSLSTPPHMKAVMHVPVEQGYYWEAVVIAGMAAEGAHLVNVRHTQEMCGTPSGARLHNRRGEASCRPCREVDAARALERHRQTKVRWGQVDG